MPDLFEEIGLRNSVDPFPHVIEHSKWRGMKPGMLTVGIQNAFAYGGGKPVMRDWVCLE